MKQIVAILSLILILLTAGCSTTSASEEDNASKLAGVTAALEAEHEASVDEVVPTLKPQSFEGKDISVEFQAYKGAKWELVEGESLDGSAGMKFNAGFLDSDYSGITITPSKETGKSWNFGQDFIFSFDAVNPDKEQKIQIRLNIFDMRKSIRTYYFNFEPGESRTLTITSEQMGLSDDVWTLPDGYWGANAGLMTDKIKYMELYIWEDNDFDSTAAEFIFDNMKVELN